MITQEEITALTKKYAGLWHIEDPYDKAIETIKFLRNSFVIEDTAFCLGYSDALKKAETALKELKLLEQSK